VRLILRPDERAPGARLRVRLTGLTVAEYFRASKADVCIIDNIFPIHASGLGSVGMLGRMPSAVGYQPTACDGDGRAAERITSTKKGSITSGAGDYVPADDLTGPRAGTAFCTVDADGLLDRAIVELGIYPAVNPLSSSSRILDAQYLGEVTTGWRSSTAHFAAATRIPRTSSRILGMDELSERGQAAWSAGCAPGAFPLTAVLRGVGNSRARREILKLEDTIAGSSGVVSGSSTSWPDRAF